MKDASDEAFKARLSVRLTPRARANAALLGLPPVHASVSHGHKSRDKVLEIIGLSEEGVRLALQRDAPVS